MLAGSPKCYGKNTNLAQLTNFTKNLVTSRNLSPCQKACVVKCVTSHYLTYKSEWNTTPCSAADKRVGDCKSFSVLADSLLDSLGLISETAESTEAAHAFDRIKIGNEWLYFEPQDDDCIFYANPKK